MNATKKIFDVCLRMNKRIFCGGSSLPVVYDTMGAEELIRANQVRYWRKPPRIAVDQLFEQAASRIETIVRDNIKEKGKYQLTESEQDALRGIIGDTLEAMFYRESSSHRHTELLGRCMGYFRRNTDLSQITAMHLSEASSQEQYRQMIYYIGFAFYVGRVKLAMELDC
jgi:hypothetical protein